VQFTDGKSKTSKCGNYSWTFKIVRFSKSSISFSRRATLYRSSWNLPTET